MAELCCIQITTNFSRSIANYQHARQIGCGFLSDARVAVVTSDDSDWSICLLCTKAANLTAKKRQGRPALRCASWACSSLMVMYLLPSLSTAHSSTASTSLCGRNQKVMSQMSAEKFTHNAPHAAGRVALTIALVLFICLSTAAMFLYAKFALQMVQRLLQALHVHVVCTEVMARYMICP